jgi:hypothetical protein
MHNAFYFFIFCEIYGQTVWVLYPRHKWKLKLRTWDRSFAATSESKAEMPKKQTEAWNMNPFLRRMAGIYKLDSGPVPRGQLKLA